ncbi:MAG: 4Fe-4S cluster-binding domain-containing protein [Alistipes sp.]|jgi:anaerobic ribonucleoside-triphosphate reductase activating protein|nr:4Fe-4S cluster-binding domain-containing protein [Alistipes sp.]
MALLASYDIVFQEVPGEVTLALNLSGCPNRCPGCHSPHLREAAGEPLDEELLDGLLARYGGSVTCVAFMGGDGEPAVVGRLAARVKATGLKTAWYSGRENLSPEVCLDNLDYVKIGPYDPARGGLSTPGTNQRFYRVEGPAGDRRMVDATALFLRNNGPGPTDPGGSARLG